VRGLEKKRGKRGRYIYGVGRKISAEEGSANKVKGMGQDGLLADEHICIKEGRKNSHHPANLKTSGNHKGFRKKTQWVPGVERNVGGTATGERAHSPCKDLRKTLTMNESKEQGKITDPKLKPQEGCHRTKKGNTPAHLKKRMCWRQPLRPIGSLYKEIGRWGLSSGGKRDRKVFNTR